jgi:hypothetical protein
VISKRVLSSHVAKIPYLVLRLGYALEDPGILFDSRHRQESFLQSIQSGSGAHQVSNLVVTWGGWGGHSWKVNWLGREAHRSPLFSTVVENAWRSSSSRAYIFMACSEINIYYFIFTSRSLTLCRPALTLRSCVTKMKVFAD